MAKKILVLDDEEILTKTFVRLLEHEGYEVLVASRGNDALVMVEEEDFDLLLCDIRMPGENGRITAKRIQELRGAQGRKDIPLLFLTGYADEAPEKEAKELKPLAYVFKPFDSQELLNMIRHGLS